MVGAAALALLRPMRLKGAKPSLSAAAPSGGSAATLSRSVIHRRSTSWPGSMVPCDTSDLVSYSNGWAYVSTRARS